MQATDAVVVVVAGPSARVGGISNSMETDALISRGTRVSTAEMNPTRGGTALTP